MQKLFTYFLFLLIPGFVQSQDCTPWFPFSEGTQFEYSFFDKKDKPTGRMEYQVKEVTQSGDSYQGVIASIFYDKKGKEVNQFEFEVSCEDGVYKADLSNFMNPSLKDNPC